MTDLWNEELYKVYFLWNAKKERLIYVVSAYSISLVYSIDVQSNLDYPNPIVTWKNWGFG
jgi:hypothetical protein